MTAIDYSENIDLCPETVQIYLNATTSNHNRFNSTYDYIVQYKT